MQRRGRAVRHGQLRRRPLLVPDRAPLMPTQLVRWSCGEGQRLTWGDLASCPQTEHADRNLGNRAALRAGSGIGTVLDRGCKSAQRVGTVPTDRRANPSSSSPPSRCAVAGGVRLRQLVVWPPNNGASRARGLRANAGSSAQRGHPAAARRARVAEPSFLVRLSGGFVCGRSLARPSCEAFKERGLGSARARATPGGLSWCRTPAGGNEPGSL
jgi:hypothetical protein